MADSLKDQLIAAGYKAPKDKEKRKPKAAGKRKPKKNTPARKQQPTATPPPSAKNAAQDAAAIEERKALKAKIKLLIDENKVDEWKGEVVYRYMVDKRIRELYVTEKVQSELAARALAITRLNGDTYVVPRAIALAIKEINPQWSVFNLDEETAPAATETDDYAEFKVPDDLKW